MAVCAPNRLLNLVVRTFLSSRSCPLIFLSTLLHRGAQSVSSHQKALTSDFFFFPWLIYGHLPTLRWQVLDIKRAELPRGPLCGFRWRLESLLNLHCNEWLSSASAGEHRRNSVTASLWTSGEGGLRVCLCICVSGLWELEGQVVSDGAV